MRKCGIEQGNLHAFRRFFITTSANRGVEPFQLAAWVGHSDLKMVLRYYHLKDDASRAAMKRLDFVQELAGGAAPSAGADSETDSKQAQNKDSEDERAA